MAFDRLFTQVEVKIFGRPTWATESTSFKDRALFYRDTGFWPGFHRRDVTEMML